MNYPSRLRLILGLIVMLGLLGANTLHAVTLLNDTFEGSTDNPGWISATNALVPGTGVTLSVETSGSGLTGNALLFTNTQNNRTALRELSQAVTLDVGDWISISLDLRYPNTPPSVNNSYFLGIYNSATTDGFQVRNNFGSDVSTAGKFSDAPFVGNYGNVPGQLVGTDPFNVEFTITRTAAEELQMSVSFDGGTPITSSAVSTTTEFTFDRVFVGHGGFQTSFYMDNVIVTSSVPEPGALALAVPGFLMLNLLPRRRRR